MEKPLAISLEEGRGLVAAAKAKGTPLGVLYHKRYAPQHAGLKRFIDQGGFGPGPIQAEMSIHHAAGDHYFRHGEYWKASVDQNGGGILMNQVVHYLDLLTWWLGPVETVDSDFIVGQCSLEGESTARLRILFTAGHRADFFASVAVRKSLPVYWAAHGTKGSLVFHGMELIRDTIGLEANEAFRHRFKDKLLGAVPYRVRGRLGRPLSRLDDESAGSGWAEFFKSASLGKEPPVSGEEGLKVLELIEKAYGGQKPRIEKVPGMIPPEFGLGGLDYYRDLAAREPGPDVLLVNPLMLSEVNKAHAHIHTHRPRPPLGLASAASWLIREGRSARVVDAAMMGFSTPETAGLIGRFNPGKVVLTTAQSDRWQNPDIDISAAVELIRLVHEMGLGPVILLGPHGTATPEWTLRRTGADFLVRGEPERTLTELVKALEDGADPGAVPGLAWLEGEEYRESPARIFEDDLSDYPIPAFDQLPLTPLPVLRGDPAQALQLHAHLAGLPGRLHLLPQDHDAGQVAGPVRGPDRGGDGVPEGKLRYPLHLLPGLGVSGRSPADQGALPVAPGEELKHPLGRFHPGLVPEGPEYVKTLARAGCVLLNCGYETGSQELLDKIDKKIKLESAYTAVDNCRAAGIELRLFGLVNLPGETFSTIRQSMRFLIKAGTEVVHPNLPIPYPTTRLWEMSGQRPDWDRLEGFEGRVQTRIRPALALAYFKHLNRNRRFGWGYPFRPRFWRYLRLMGYLRLGRFIPGF